uniref:Uncharacterized protein n=1 Tax=Eutreptiella gymnastica TaxID=73025 RepID=A0A6T1YZR1_9EUGL
MALERAPPGPVEFASSLIANVGSVQDLSLKHPPVIGRVWCPMLRGRHLTTPQTVTRTFLSPDVLPFHRKANPELLSAWGLGEGGGLTQPTADGPGEFQPGTNNPCPSPPPVLDMVHSRCGLLTQTHSFFLSRPRWLAYLVHHMALETTSWDGGSELSGAAMIPQMPVVADLTCSED